MKNSLTVLKYGIQGKKEYDFDVNIILDIMPIILNKLIVFLLDGHIF
jgi:hypothetical protein